MAVGAAGGSSSGAAAQGSTATVVAPEQDSTAAQAWAAAGGAQCVRFFTSVHVTCTYLYTGAEQTLVLPTSATSVSMEVVGAKGGSAATAFDSARGGPIPAGTGSTVFGSLPVPGGTTLFVEVGETRGSWDPGRVALRRARAARVFGSAGTGGSVEVATTTGRTG